MNIDIFINLYSKAIKNIKILLKKENRLIHEGNKHLSKGDYYQAKYCYERAIIYNPKSAVAHLNLAFVLKEENNFILAQDHLKKCLAIKPLLADGWYLLAGIDYTSSNFDSAINHYKKTLEIDPQFENAYTDLVKIVSTADEKLSAVTSILTEIIKLHPKVWLPYAYLASLYQQNGNNDDAINTYEAALSLGGSHTELYTRLAGLYEAREDLSKAEILLTQAVNADSGNIKAAEKLATFIYNHRSFSQALKLYEQILETHPERGYLWSNIANIHIANNDFEKAKICLEKYQKYDATDVAANHLLDALNGKTPEYSPIESTQKLFDGYAKNFEKHLTETLHYNAPQKLVELLLLNPLNHQHLLNVLDLGCGTGLVGQLLKDHKQHLIGVDISSNMLEKANEKKCYDQFIHADLVDTMKRSDSDNYSLIVSADVFIYVGKLDDIFTEAARILTKEGLFAFTVESLDTAQPDATHGYSLQKNARYAHHSSYIKNLAEKNGFSLQLMHSDQIRIDFGKTIIGWYVICQKIISD